jgi:hypothetical protein
MQPHKTRSLLITTVKKLSPVDIVAAIQSSIIKNFINKNKRKLRNPITNPLLLIYKCTLRTSTLKCKVKVKDRNKTTATYLLRMKRAPSSLS